MNMISKIISALLCCVVAINASAQVKKDFKAVDEYVKKVGALDSMTMGTISEIVTKPFADRTEKVRAIFDWIAYNISFDCKTARSGNTDKNTTVDVLASRKAVGIGYATLFQDMCSSANIRCLTVDGFVKKNIEEIGDPETDINHSWAVVQLGQSPEDWYYVDPTWGSGYTDADMKTFTRSYNDAYFFADKAIFNLQHYPDNEAWKLGEAPKNKKDFFALPIISSAAFDFGVKRISPSTGHLLVGVDKAEHFSFAVAVKEKIEKVTLLIGKKKPRQEEMQHSFSGGSVIFSYKFKEDGDYPVTILVNGKALATYHVEAESK